METCMMCRSDKIVIVAEIDAYDKKIIDEYTRCDGCEAQWYTAEQSDLHSQRYEQRTGIKLKWAGDSPRRKQ